MSARAEKLAARVREGAAGLAAFVSTLSETEWKTPIPHDGRTVGVVVHHVAFVYPIEIDLARSIGRGEATPTSWDDVKNLNANHAKEHANVTKAEALAFLAQQSAKAADAVAAMTDAELDTAAPFGLSYGAPVTAQFVVEDHPVRHSWHHLAHIRKTLGR